jgi:hypothetical protein
MATYIVTGHPLGTPDNIPNWEAIRCALQTIGVGAPITITLPAPVETVLEASDVLEA